VHYLTPAHRKALGNERGSGRPFITGIYAHGGRGYFDAVAAHPYATPDVDTTGIAWLRSTVDTNGDTYKPIWLTEYGWNVNNVGEQNKATYREDSLNGFAAESSATIAAFQIIADIPARNTYMGLTDQALNPRQAYSTFSSYGKPTT
jgi:Glycosyl hydrolase catalytic core